MIKKKYIDRKRGAGRNEKEALAHALLGSYLYKTVYIKAVKRNKVRSVLG